MLNELPDGGRGYSRDHVVVKDTGRDNGGCDVGKGGVDTGGRPVAVAPNKISGADLRRAKRVK